jgi:hypothetical protein
MGEHFCEPLPPRRVRRQQWFRSIHVGMKSSSYGLPPLVPEAYLSANAGSVVRFPFRRE